MSEYFRDALHELTKPQIAFICKECSVSRDSLFTMTNEELNDVYEKMCDIEIRETPDEGKLSDRCKLASDIVTVMGNALAEAMGWLDEEDFDDWEDE